MDFDSMPEDTSAAVPAFDEMPAGQPEQTAKPKAFGVQPPSVPSFDEMPDDSQNYGTPGQQALTAIEGGAKGFAGPVATGAEALLNKAGVPNLTPEDQRAREQVNPWTHGLSEAAGFGAGMLAGTGEAALLGKAGEAAAGLAGLGETTNVASKLAKGAVTAATEMGLYQAGDESSKLIQQDPNQTVGSAAVNIGLSSLLGGATGPLFKGAGLLLGSALDNPQLKNFVDRAASRASGASNEELLQNDLENIISSHSDLMQNTARDVAAQELEKNTSNKIPENIQKILNKNPNMFEDIANTFMTPVDGELKMDPAKFQDFMSKDVSERHAILGKFAKTIKNQYSAIDELYKSAGVLNPNPPVGTASLDAAIGKPSLGAKLYDSWYDKSRGEGLADLAATAAGAKLFPVPEIGGAILGEKILGPVFRPIFKNFITPILSKFPNVDAPALQHGMSFLDSAKKGENLLTDSIKDLLSGGKVLPAKIMPDSKDLDKLDETTEKLGKNPKDMENIAGSMGFYTPGHSTALAATGMRAVNYINSQRPIANKQYILDSPPVITTDQKEAFKRTLSIAQQPLSVFQHIKNGTLLPSDVMTLKSIYPEYYDKMSQQMLTQVVDASTKGIDIPYKTRIGLSLFTASPLDSTMSPQSIIAAQPIPAPPMQSPKGAPSRLKAKDSNKYMTANQSAESDRSNRS